MLAGLLEGSREPREGTGGRLDRGRGGSGGQRRGLALPMRCAWIRMPPLRGFPWWLVVCPVSTAPGCSGVPQVGPASENRGYVRGPHPRSSTSAFPGLPGPRQQQSVYVAYALSAVAERSRGLLTRGRRVDANSPPHALAATPGPNPFSHRCRSRQAPNMKEGSMLRSMLPLVIGTALAVALLAGAGGVFADPPFDNEQHNGMKLVGTNDLQARSTYQPTLHKYSGNRYILFTGHHTLGTNPVTGAPLPSFNPITGKNEENGTSIVDVTDPNNPVYLVHIPVPDGQGGGAQMVRVCDGIGLNAGKVFMLRSYSNSAHKSWWECDSGIAYIVGRRGNDTADLWKAGNHIFIFDLSDPANPVFLRDWALEGQEPGGAIPPHFTAVPSIHGPISTGPAGGFIDFAGATANRVYFAYGTSSNGTMQIVDRTKLLPPPFGTGIKCGSAASSLTPPACNAATGDFKSAEVGRWIMNPVNGAHTSFPIGKILVPDFFVNQEGQVRDFVVVTSEETNNQCTGPRNLTYMVEVTEGVTGEAAGTTRPQSQANFQVLEESGEFCDVGGRFGPHSTQEEFGPPFYQKIVFVSYFDAGVRAVDIRDPLRPKEVGFFIPATTPNTAYRCVDDTSPGTCLIAIQTNNVATDDRGFIYIIDRADTGLHVLQLTGGALKIIK